MKLYLLDTDTITHYLRNHPRLLISIGAQSAINIELPIVAIEEIWGGWSLASKRAKDDAGRGLAYDRLTESLNRISHWSIRSFAEAAIVRYAHLKSLRLNVRANDLKIAAIAMEAGGIVVSRNLRDFRRVPNLEVENWVDAPS